MHFACGHTNFVLRCIQAGVPLEDPLLSVNGKMRLAQLREQDPNFASAVDRGLRWKVLRWQAREQYPEVLNLLQEARNVAGHIQRQENEMRGLLQLHNLAASAMKRKEILDWSVIKRIVRRSRPPFAESLDNMVAFVAARSGGIQGQYFK